jgi:hypothetical protein
VSLVARIVLGGVFLAAGVAKATSSGGRRFEASLRGFGFGAAAARPVARLLPLIEIALAALLLAGAAVRVAAIATMALLVLFDAVIVRVLVRGDRVDCGCFGAASQRPVSIGTLGRNAALTVVAAVAAAEGRLAAPWTPLPAVLVAVAILAVLGLASESIRSLT